MKKSNNSAGTAHTFLTSAQTLCIIAETWMFLPLL